MADDPRSRCQSCAHNAAYFRVSPTGLRMLSHNGCTNPHVITPTKGCAWHTPRREGIATTPPPQPAQEPNT